MAWDVRVARTHSSRSSLGAELWQDVEQRCMMEPVRVAVLEWFGTRMLEPGQAACMLDLEQFVDTNDHV